MKKKIIFFDGDGTIWYPSLTKRTRKPHWIYNDPDTKDNFLSHMELTPNLRATLLELKRQGIILILISASPYATKTADAELREKLAYFNILDLFHSYHSSPGDKPEGKGKIMLEVVDSLGFAKKDALMIGDSYYYDYLAAENVGIDAYLIANESSEIPEQQPNDLRTIIEVNEIVDILTV